ncbi:DUF3710 domain-containing protein [Corynebacterium alimapuense]|uniref:DUF3710 domain-containing protein n=1 Tax=Corynebacterium alimapuense TaxID=1576874 RepID=A0A3M8K8T0_9CORY|nr:DUF3710 domain-containing protein [Corynebacterium alimapuense]RNE49289.1 DUF3710 domain-containing protein [Corynebacterium alimapuense]
MALWPFGKKKDEQVPDEALVEATSTDLIAEPELPSEETPIAVEALDHDAVSGETGPFDGDSVEITDFDFSEFSTGVLNLGSMKIPLPKNSQVQVEMGEKGPKMVHIVTEFGRITPVAFAAPRSAGQWSESLEQITQGMSRDGLDVEVEQGPWGPEVVGKSAKGIIRVIGVDGPRWMLRLTNTAPLERAEGLRDLSREVVARTFVYRGENPILAGNSLPVALPQQLVAQVQKALEQRSQQANKAAKPTAAAQPTADNKPSGQNTPPVSATEGAGSDK